MTAAAASEPCFVNGGGIISTDSGIDVFGGIAASPKAGSTRGHWEHVTAAGDRLEGDVHFLSCSLHPGLPADPPSTFVNVAELGGTAIWNGQAGYFFDVTVEDHGEPGTLDRYSLEVWYGGTVYSVDEPLAGGNIQIHPPNEGHPY